MPLTVRIPAIGLLGDNAVPNLYRYRLTVRFSPPLVLSDLSSQRGKGGKEHDHNFDNDFCKGSRWRDFSIDTKAIEVFVPRASQRVHRNLR